MVIGINGKIGSGKDTIGRIIQYLTSDYKDKYDFVEWIDRVENYRSSTHSKFEVKKFAGKLKQIASMLTGIPVEKFEDQEFKKTNLPEHWNTLQQSGRNKVSLPMTVRELLQKLGTEAMRQGLHTNVWVNALFADYNPGYTISPLDVDNRPPDKWIITDMRFPNEMEAVVNKEGITIRVVRYKVGDKVYWTDPEDVSSGLYEITEVYQDFCFIKSDFSEAQVPYHEIKQHVVDLHPSETALDDAEFDYEIINDETLDELVEKVKEILIKESII